METSAVRPPLNVNVKAIYASSIGDAWPLLLSRQKIYLTLAAIGVMLTLSGLLGSSALWPQAFDAFWNILDVIGICFIIPSIVRTANPAFVMTPGRLIVGFFVFLGIVLAAAICSLALILPWTWIAMQIHLNIVTTSLLSTLALIWPGAWIFVKLSLSYMLYQLGSKDPFQASWSLTNGYFWRVTLLLFITFLTIWAISFVLLVPQNLLINAFPWAILPCGIIIFGINLWLNCFSGLITLRLTLRLLEITQERTSLSRAA